MQRAEMKLFWISMVLLSLGLSHAKDKLSAGNDKQKTVCMATGDSVSVSCPNLTAEEVTFHFLMGRQQIGSHRYNRSVNETRSANRTVCEERDCELHVNRTDWSVSFVLFNVTSERAGFYTCEMEVTYPPPFKNVKSPSGVLVLVEGHQCMLKSCECTASDGDQMAVWIWWLGLGAVSIYGLIVTVIALVIWARLRKADWPQNDYINTKPMVPPGHRQNKGVLHPGQRCF